VDSALLLPTRGVRKLPMAAPSATRHAAHRDEFFA